MTWNKQTQQISKQGKRSGKKTASKMPLPGSVKRIEKALTLPTTDKPNPYLNRLDPKLEKPPPNQSAKPPSNQPSDQSAKPPEK